ncbi:hypothetical protein CEXT_568561 [Caerostris extrusa]|uniref:Uncharacterized protein n=1 Tax=Caerostris extrusa TaxID=172846 RepID=A0AAV4YE28_CAEEX|nr:hypothetical protein CEXT_568561 [Caerostris extrusa]
MVTGIHALIAENVAVDGELDFDESFLLVSFCPPLWSTQFHEVVYMAHEILRSRTERVINESTSTEGINDVFLLLCDTWLTAHLRANKLTPCRCSNKITTRVVEDRQPPAKEINRGMLSDNQTSTIRESSPEFVSHFPTKSEARTYPPSFCYFLGGGRRCFIRRHLASANHQQKGPQNKRPVVKFLRHT